MWRPWGSPPRSTDYKMGLKKIVRGKLLNILWLYNFFVKKLVINYISTRSLKNIIFSAKFTSPIYDDKYHIIILNCD